MAQELVGMRERDEFTAQRKKQIPNRKSQMTTTTTLHKLCMSKHNKRENALNISCGFAVQVLDVMQHNISAIKSVGTGKNKA